MYRICQVCGDTKSVGRNYGSITCKSCRVFFWRAITNNKVLKCPSKGTCSIDKAFRSICPNCRLNKCFTVGMKRERHRICTDIIAFKNNDNNNNFDEIEDLITETLNISTDGLVDQMNEIENCLQTTYIDTNNELKSLNNIYYGKNKCQDPTLMPIIPVLTDHKGWNQMETIKLSELLTSSHVFSYPMADTRHIIRDKIEFFRVLSQYTENSISDVVKFTKGLNGFKIISAADQYTLIKHGCFELLTLRYLVYYDHRNDCFNFPYALQCKNTTNKLRPQMTISSLPRIRTKRPKPIFESFVSCSSQATLPSTPTSTPLSSSSCANLYALYTDVHIGVQVQDMSVVNVQCAQFRASNSANHTASDSTCNCAHWATGGANRCAYLGTSVA
ncbi:unnamed protein product [Medioppia subpectinata]|uniref:Nuclear receptor domain-containing protein n=1 Tax=Medioppia subpectinata TaxID=1979941 RepID=A0A7R9KQR0_9ACAR|nr:unnamed protein product [Medioppia subpectinata]CAG2107660.1 unnamed protein product [Medioppia subpectinata]